MLEVPLLDRTTRPLKLTPAGRTYLDFCRDVLRRKEEFDAAIDLLKRDVEGQVRVAAIYSIGLVETSVWDEEFHRRYPGAVLEVEYLRPDRVYEAVRGDTADLGLVSYPEPARDLTVIDWREEVMLVAVPPEHPLAVNTFLDPRQLDGQAFVGFDEDLPIGQEILRFLRGYGVEVNIVMRFDNVLMIKEAVALGSGISILPEPAVRHDLAAERLIGIPLESPGLYRPIGVIHRRGKVLNRAARAFLQMLLRSPEGAAAKPPARRPGA
jgi:DNA-binding transcriptional LysR family regulator